MTTVSEVIEATLTPIVDACVAQRIAQLGVLTGPAGPQGSQGPAGPAGAQGVQGPVGPAGTGAGSMAVPKWDMQTGVNWPTMQAALWADQVRFSTLPKPTCSAVILPSSLSVSGTNQFSSAIAIAEGRHVVTPHTTPNGTMAKARIVDYSNNASAATTQDLVDGPSRSNGVVAFPDNDVMPVPSNATAITVYRLNSGTSTVFPNAAPGSAAYLGGALWIDGVSALLAPHNANYACLVNKNTGVVTQLTDYNFGGNFACAGVRRVGVTGEYAFVPHNHSKFVLLDPVAMTFRVLPFDAPGAESYLDCTNLNTGELYYAAHKALCSLVVDVVAGTKLDTLPPNGPNYVEPTLELVGSVMKPKSNFRTCRRLPDGDVLKLGFKHPYNWIYNRATNRHRQSQGTATVAAVACSAMSVMGDTIAYQWNGADVYKFATGYGVQIDPQIVTSPLFNGF